MPERSQFEGSKSFVEVTLVDEGFVLFVGRTSILLERDDAEAVIASLACALSRSSIVGSTCDGPERRS